MPSLNIFATDAFGLVQLTDAVNKLPFVPGRLGQLGLFQEVGITTTSIEIEEQDGVLGLVGTTARGGPGKQFAPGARTVRTLKAPHIQIDHTLMADAVQNVRAFGSESEAQSVQGVLNARMAEMTASMDATLEFHRIGAVKGVVYDADASTPLYSLFTTFGVSQEAEVDFDLDNATPASGVVRKKCATVARLVQTNIGALPFAGIRGLCGDAFFDDLIAHAEVRATYLNQQAAADLREGYAYQTLNYGGIMFENYRGGVGATAFVHTDKCHFYPEGAPGLFKTYFAPADLPETVNTNGLPRYARQYPLPNGKGITVEVQTNPLCICTRPKVLILAKRT